MKKETIKEMIKRIVKEERRNLNEDLYQSKTLSDAVYNNLGKTTKKGGPISMSVKNNNGSAEIIATVYFDVDAKKFMSRSEFDDFSPSIKICTWNAKYSSSKNIWIVNGYRNDGDVFDLSLSKGQKVPDDQMNRILNKFFDSIK